MRRLILAAPGALLLAYYAVLGWAIYKPPPIVSAGDGARAEGGPVYGFWSGFGGTLLFSALVLLPPWYYQHSCHYSLACMRWGKHPAAGGVFKLCGHHHPDIRRHTGPRRDLIERLHAEWKRGAP